MRIFRRFTTQIVTVVMMCLLVCAGIIRDAVINARADNDVRPVIIIDAGHGGLTNTIKV